jgi:hypothetical protein
MKIPDITDKKASPANIRLFTTDHPDTPVPNKDRIQYLDILRGIAILFILLANIRYLSGEYFISDLQKATMKTSFLNHVMEILAFIFVDGKFYSVFSILFGIGFAVQYQRMNKDDKVFVPFFRRRMTGIADHRKCAPVPDLAGRYPHPLRTDWFYPDLVSPFYQQTLVDLDRNFAFYACSSLVGDVPDKPFLS